MSRSLVPCLAALLLLFGCTHAPESPSALAPAAAEAAPRVEPWLNPDLAPAIDAFVASDRADPPESGQVLFIGSSSVRMWRTLSEDMAPAPVINRGFGGSTTPEILAVADRIVFPYQPSVIVYYCGDNDLGTDNTDAAAAAAGFTQFADLVHERLPETRILYMSIKPSIARWSNWPAMARANRIVSAYCDEHGFATYMDLALPLLNADGEPDPELFLDDGLHLNAAGYERWTTIVRPLVVHAYGDTERSNTP